MASRKKASEKSETELEMKTKVIRRKQNKELKVFQNTAKSVNSSYVVDAVMKSQNFKTSSQNRNTKSPVPSDIVLLIDSQQSNTDIRLKEPISSQNGQHKSSVQVVNSSGSIKKQKPKKM